MAIALVVDDVKVNRFLAKRLLDELGREVVEAEDGIQALEQLEQHQINLILLDIQMPRMSGEECCVAIRQRLDGAQYAIVAYTAHAFSTDLQRFLENGFDATLSKPVSKEAFANAVHAAMVKRID